jgi:hypothetical protein
MYEDLYSAFLDSGDTLRIYIEEDLVFSSEKDRLFPMMEYLEEYGQSDEPVTIFDKIMGNAAALLAVKIKCDAVYSPVGSELAIETLENNGIAYHLNKVVPYIMRADGKDMCPMEKLSMDKTPDEFYREMRKRIESNK